MPMGAQTCPVNYCSDSLLSTVVGNEDVGGVGFTMDEHPWREFLRRFCVCVVQILDREEFRSHLQIFLESSSISLPANPQLYVRARWNLRQIVSGQHRDSRRS